MTENINMQMESDYSDLLDRKLISLYGMQDGNPTKMDSLGTETKAIRAINDQKFKRSRKNSNDQLTNISMDAITQANSKKAKHQRVRTDESSNSSHSGGEK